MVALTVIGRELGFIAMAQQMGGDKKSREPMRHHGLLGVYTASNQQALPNDSLESLIHALQTSLPVASRQASCFALATTGDAHELPGGGAAIIVGRPHFKAANLAKIAQTHGFAAALAQGYQDFSKNVFSHLFGSFGCAIIDVEKQRILIAVDRLGLQSMYYHENAVGLCFGSTAGSILACTEDRPELMNQGVYNYLYFHMVPSPGSVYHGLAKLPGSHYLDYHNGQSQLVNYWRPTFAESTATKSMGAQSSQLKAVLKESVERCLADSGNVGSFLSGGLDSSTVTGILAELREREAAAYSIGFSAEGYDEMAYARIASRHFNIELNEYYVTPQDVVDALPMIATSYDEPFGNSSALPAYFCAKMAFENGVDTLLAGDGGDEIFGGNERYVKQKVFEHYNTLPIGIRRRIIEPLIHAMPQSLPLVPKANSYIAQANTPLPDRMQSYNFLHRHEASEIFSDDFLTEVDTDYPLRLLRSIYHRPEDASELNRMLYLDWQITLADNDLRKVTQTCALAGVNVVYPMLDDALIDFSCQIPSAWKIKGRNLRHFYKHALTGWLPQETINKTKQGFGLPFGVWMQTYKPLRELAYDNLLKLKRRRLIRPEFIDRAIAMHQSEHAAYYGELVWILTVFELWMQGHCDNKTG
ncbi:MAG: asparagine synthase-related protein [Halioglobus sp.]